MSNEFDLEKDIHIVRSEINKAIKDLNLNLRGLTILTEAASDIFAVAPIIALMANAKKVFAIGQTNKFGFFQEIARNLENLSSKIGLDTSKLTIVEKSKFKEHGQIDIITNLGHVRPLSAEVLPLFKTGSVISFMREDWEDRASDVDLKSAQKYGLLVYGVNEDYPQVNCFREVGLIALKLIFESRISLFGSRVAIVSRDKFGLVILGKLRNYTQKIRLIKNFKNISEPQLKNLDLMIIADYLYPGIIVGRKGIIKPKILKRNSPHVKIIQFCGQNALDDVRNAEISIYPDLNLKSHRMFATLGDISYRAIIRLYTGGLKVGELGFRKNISQKYRSLIQNMGIKGMEKYGKTKKN